MSSELALEIVKVTKHLADLQALVSKALTQSIKAFEDLDVELASEITSVSDQGEELHYFIENFVFNAVSQHQPTGIDLRRLATYYHTSGCLRNIGRYARLR